MPVRRPGTRRAYVDSAPSRTPCSASIAPTTPRACRPFLRCMLSTSGDAVSDLANFGEVPGGRVQSQEQRSNPLLLCFLPEEFRLRYSSYSRPVPTARLMMSLFGCCADRLCQRTMVRLE